MARVASGTGGQARDLARRRQRLDDWRGRRGRGGAVPPRVWAAAGRGAGGAGGVVAGGGVGRGERERRGGGGGGAAPGIEENQRDELRWDRSGTRQDEAAVETRCDEVH